MGVLFLPCTFKTVELFAKEPQTYSTSGSGTPCLLRHLANVWCETLSKALATSKKARARGRRRRWASFRRESRRYTLSAHPSTGRNAFCLGSKGTELVNRAAMIL